MGLGCVKSRPEQLQQAMTALHLEADIADRPSEPDDAGSVDGT